MDSQERQRIMALGLPIYFEYIRPTLLTVQDAEIVFQIGLKVNDVYTQGYIDGMNSIKNLEQK